ncbi:UNVERIFIED_ORG: hypothetical protein J2X79_000239 [Arthrobacter globiformis]|nr:hypothetical protein [Arthrobacter globiformis]
MAGCVLAVARMPSNRSQRRQWIAAVRKSDLPPEVKAVAHTLADYANEDGQIADPGIAALLDWCHAPCAYQKGEQ